jgi:hypothetical protein
MTIRKACVEGIRQTNRSFPMVLLLFGLNFLLAGIVAMLFRSVVITEFGNSLVPLKLIRDFDFTVYIDFIEKNQGKLSAVYALITWFVALSNLFGVFFDGGIIVSVQADSERFRFQTFCASCGEFFGRFLRLFFIAVPAMLISGLVMLTLSGIVFSAVAGTGETEIQLLRGFSAAIVVFSLPMSILILASDYARVITVAEHEQRMFRAFWLGLRFVFRKLINVYILFLLWFILSILLLACWAVLTTQIVVDSGLLVLGIFLIQQIIAIGRSWIRVASIGSQVALYVPDLWSRKEYHLYRKRQFIKKMNLNRNPASVELDQKLFPYDAKAKVKPLRTRKRVISTQIKKTVKNTSKRVKK